MPPTSFLDLPAELRNRCYKFSLNGVEAHLHRERYQLIFRDDISRFDHSLLQACRQTRQEILPLMATIPLRLHSGLERAAEILTKDYSNTVQSVIIRKPSSGSCKQQDRARSFARRCLAQFPMLKELVIRLRPKDLPSLLDRRLYISPNPSQSQRQVRDLALKEFALIRRYMPYDALPPIKLTIWKRYDIKVWTAPHGFIRMYQVSCTPLRACTH